MSDDGVCHGGKIKLGKKGYRHVYGSCFGKCDQIGPLLRKRGTRE